MVMETNNLCNMKLRRGDIVLVSIPEIGGSVQCGNRPALVITNDTYSNSTSTVVNVILLTSRMTKKPMKSHVFMSKKDFPFLKKDSYLLCEHPRVIDKCMIISKVWGNIADTPHMKIVNENIARQLGLAM